MSFRRVCVKTDPSHEGADMKQIPLVSVASLGLVQREVHSVGEAARFLCKTWEVSWLQCFRISSPANYATNTAKSHLLLGLASLLAFFCKDTPVSFAADFGSFSGQTPFSGPQIRRLRPFFLRRPRKDLEQRRPTREKPSGMKPLGSES